MSKKDDKFVDSKGLGEKFKSLKNVKLLGDFKVDQFGKDRLTVYRYIRYARAKDIIESKKISFADPRTWEDPFEKRFACGDYKSLGFAPKELACMCVTTEHGENEAAFWRMFDPDGKHDLVQLTLDFSILLKALNYFAKKNNATIYVKPCDYTYTSEDLKSSGKGSFLKDRKKFDDEDFIELMSLKRRAFASEKELRFFIYGENLPFVGNFLSIPYKGRLVKELKVCPKPDFTAFVSSEDIVKDVLVSHFKKELRITKSRLYDSVSSFKAKK